METSFKDSIELKLHLLDKYGISEEPKTIDFCREAYKFIAEGDMTKFMGVDKNGAPIVERIVSRETLSETLADIVERLPKLCSCGYALTIALKDGVYLVYGDGHIELFDGSNKKDGAIQVAFKFGSISLTIFHDDIDDVTMETDDDEPCNYITSYSVAAHDFNGIRNTEILERRGLSFFDAIPHCCWVPSLGELYVMYMLKTYINDALKYIGQTPLKDEWYWSSSEYSATLAWGLGFSDGLFGSSDKEFCFSVRPVSAFYPLSL